MALDPANQYFEAEHSGPATPASPNLFNANEIVAAGGINSAAISTATSTAVSTVNAAAPDSTSISQARSQAVSAATNASIADSKAVSGSVVTSIADSKALSVSQTCSIADSKAVSVATATPIVTAVVYSQNISTADSKATSIATATDLPARLPTGGRTVVNLTTYLANNSRFNIADFGADMTGATDSTTAIRNCYATAAAYAIANGGADVYWPMGTPLVRDTITINAYRVNTHFAQGAYATHPTFNPFSSAAMFKIQYSNTAQQIAQGFFTDIAVSGGGSQQKILFDFYDQSDWTLENIITATWTGNSGSSSTPSIAIRSAGRELLHLKHATLFADRPIHLQNNANAPNTTEATDHYRFTDLYFSTQVASETGILIDANVAVSNILFDGDQAWVGGKYGLDYTAGGSTGVTGFQAAFHNVRYEQSADATGYAFRWQPQGCQNLLLSNCYFGSASNGSYIRNTARVEYNSCQYAGGAGTVAADWDSSCDYVLLLNTFFQDLSTVNKGTLVEVFSLPKRNTSSPIPPTVYYANPAVTNQFKVAAVNATNGQYAFPAAQVTSSDPNTLDDYEEGTWTPSVGGSATYTTQTGTYTKVGRKVTVRCSLTINALGTGSASAITGLPFAAETTTSCTIGFFSSLALSVTSLSAYISGSTITLTGLTAAAASMTNPIAALGNGAQIQLSATYNV